MSADACPAVARLPRDALDAVAAYFQVLAEPTRLQVLNLLRLQERSVGELARLCGSSAANVSRHLALLSRHGLVRRYPRGNCVFYAVADPAVYALCDTVCAAIAERLQRAAAQQAALVSPGR